jgi:hypothetical protein
MISLILFFIRIIYVRPFPVLMIYSTLRRASSKFKESSPEGQRPDTFISIKV